jgi:hypothetical protein
VLLTTIAGRIPTASDEVTLGRRRYATWGPMSAPWCGCRSPMRTAGPRRRPIGVTSFPPDFGTGGLGTGAVFDFAGSVRDVRRERRQVGVPSKRRTAARA